MAKEVIGVYESRAEAIEEINKLQDLSYSKNQLVVVARDEETIDTIENNTELDMDDKILDTDVSWFDELMARFKGETAAESVRDNIIELGVPELEANRIVGLIDDGKIVALAETNANVLNGNGTAAGLMDDDTDDRLYTDENLINSQSPFDLMENRPETEDDSRPKNNDSVLIETGTNIDLDTEHSQDTNSFGSTAGTHRNTDNENTASEIQYNGKQYNPNEKRDVESLAEQNKNESGR